MMKKHQQTSDEGRLQDLKRYKPDHTVENSVAVVLNNESIIRQIVKNDPQAGFDMIFKRYYKPLCSHAVRFLYSKDLAEDVVSDVLLKFWKTKLYETVTTTYRAYLYTAVRNASYNHLKKEFMEQTVKKNLTRLHGNDMETLDPHTILLLDELFLKVQKTVDAFPPQCRKVFLMSRFEGRKNREIADALQLKVKTVEAHMMKALAELRKVLQHYIH